jgi:hypothetical protein
MASSRKQLEDALIAAHEAGDTEAAELFAQEIKGLSSLGQSNPGEYDSTSPEFRANYGATSGMTGLDKFMAGAGKSVVDTGRGLKQLGIEALDLVRPKQVQDLVAGTPAEQYRAQMSQVKAQDADLMGSGAGIAGNIAGTLATTMIPAGALSKVGGAAGAAARGFINPQTLRGAAAGGAALGAIQPVGTDDSRIANAGIGALTSGAGQALIKGLGRIAQPIKNALSPVDQKAVDTLKAAGVPLDAAQASGSQRAMQLKRFLADNPLTAGGQAGQAEKTAAGFTQAALKEIGEDASVADEAVLGRATQRIGQVFDDVAARNPIKVDDSLLTGIAEISDQATKELEGAQAAVIVRQADEIVAKGASGVIDGKAYQNLKSTLDRISGGANQQIGHLARQLRSQLDEALQRSASDADYMALKTARKQYGNLQSIINAVNPDGNVSPAKLYNAMNVKAFGQKKAMATGIGQKQLAKLAKAGKRVIPDRMPNSGTTPRALLQLALPGAIGAGYGAAQGGDLSDIAGYAAGGVAAPYLLQKAMNNPAAVEYLTQGLRGPTRNLLLASGTTPANLLLRGAPTAGLLGLQTQQQ